MREYSAIVILSAVAIAASSAAEYPTAEDRQALADLMSRPLAERAIRWECSPSARYVCTPEGCERSPGVVSVRLNFAENTYARCDSKGCDSHSMSFSAVGIFTRISLPDSGSTFFKVLNDGSQYVEVASSQLAINQNFGACKPGP